MDQVLGVVRLQLLNFRLGVLVPLGVLGAVMAINLAMFAANGPGTDPTAYTSARLTFYLTVGTGYLQIATQTFRFVLGMGVTRRAFATAVAVLAVLEAAGYGALLGVLRLVEQATDGWGTGLELLGPGHLGADAGPLLHWLAYAVPFVALAAAGAFVGAVFARWAAPGVYGLVIGLTVVLGGSAVLITLADGWAAIPRWLAAQPPLALTTGYPLVLAALLGGAGWLVLRRTSA
ncbi:hypothetical protein [Pseudonocardia humida]|uniref:ABC transporter permease n=1 Tax=Pseudonocardia humida TaxID=2800819 RepID=A0ABT1A807_9PSEU|nr:hypothetical protein [Pseudonocardia humida]MCO1659152.1 hypothetical protein [Pseudonocardia humida]